MNTPPPTPELEESKVSTTDQQVNPYPQPYSRLKTISISLLLVLITAVAGYYYYSKFVNLPLPSSPPQSADATPIATPPVSPRPIFDQQINVSGFSIGIPSGWKVSISTQTNQVLAARLYPPNADVSTVYLDVQVGPSSEFVSSPTLTLDAPSSSGNLTIRTGKENLLTSKRLVFQVEQARGSSKALLTLYGDQASIDKFKVNVIDMLNPASPMTRSSWSLVGNVRAQEQASPSASPSLQSIAGFELTKWKEIQIMEGPYPERLTQEDHPYKDGFARLYTFSALPGQRVEILAEESKEALAKSGSFIESELYDQTGALIADAGTRIVLGENALYTSSGGRYYLIVNSYPGKVGEFLLKVFDLDQVQDLYYAHYADGSELLTNYSGADQVSKNQPAVMIVRYTSPIEVVDNNKIRYFREKDSTCIACNVYIFGDITIPYTFQVNGIDIPIKITKLFLNQALIQPASGEAFPANSQISFDIDYGEDPNNPGSRAGYGGGFRTY